MVIIAGIALIVDAATALLTYSLSKESINIRAAFVHNVADALGSIAVIVAGSLIILFGWQWIDPLVTLLIAGYILWISVSEIGGVIRILMLGSPPELNAGKVLKAIENVDGVTAAHHLHLWQMQEHQAALDAHLVIAANRWDDADAIKQAVKGMLKLDFGLSHTTLEMECSIHACIGAEVIGDGDEAVSNDAHHHPHD